MIFRLEVNMDNDAFKVDTDLNRLELASILHKLHGVIHHHGAELGDGAPVFDSNGNRVGEYSISEEGS